MKILVPIVFAVDYNIRVHVAADGSGVDTSQLKHAVNPFDEIALEEALRLKEAGKAEEIIVVAIGPAKAEEGLRHCLALGADKAVRIATDQPVEPLATAKILGAYYQQMEADLVLIGKQSIDDDYGQTGQMLAACLDIPQVTFASELNVEGDTIKATREVDEGLASVSLSLPCVVTADLRLNTPRYATLPNIMKAKSKPIEVVDIASFNVDITPRLSLANYEQPSLARAGNVLANVDELIALIRQKVVAA